MLPPFLDSLLRSHFSSTAAFSLLFVSFHFVLFFLFFFTRRAAFTFSGELEIPFWSRKRRGGTALPAAVYWQEDKLK